MKTSKFLRYALFCLAAVVAFSACKKDEEEPVTPPTEENTPLCFTALEDSSTVAYGISSDSLVIPNFEYSFNGTDWYSFVHTREGWLHEGVEAVVLAKAGDKIYVRNQDKTDALSISNQAFVRFVLTGKIAASGNIMSLLNKDFEGMNAITGSHAFAGLFTDCLALVTPPSLPATQLADNCYHSLFARSGIERAPELPATEMSPSCYIWMFSQCKNLKEPPALPATQLAEWCYYEMFSGCSNLISAPALPATKMEYVCYWDMFRDCTSLTSAPALPATTLATECYREMFKGCTSLRNAPDLPATTMHNYCYNAMFDSCTSLSSAPALPGTELAEGCYYKMFQNCTNLTNAPTLPATTMANLCYGRMFQNCTSLTRMEGSLPASQANYLSYYCMFYDCTNLTQAPDIEATTLGDEACAGMFCNCTSLTQAPRLEATTLGEEACSGMFWECTSLTQAPRINATTLGTKACYSMFQDCSSLVELPELPATQMAYGCYWAMFAYCTSAVRAPRLPATTLADKCYDWIFGGCTNLNYVEVDFDQWPTDSTTFEWVVDVAPEGTFVCPATLADERGISRIPEGWTKTENPLAKGSMAQSARKASPCARHARSNRMPQPQFLEKGTEPTTIPPAARCCR